MDIDVYQLCPCQSGKKIKFCCSKDIVSDLKKIIEKNNAGQYVAALDLLERVMAKSGPRNSLLTIQTHIFLAHQEAEKAKASNELFLKNNPDHPTGLLHRAMIELLEDNVPAAVNSLQDAMDAIPGAEIPIAMATGFRMVGIALLQQGHLVGARAHLTFASFLRDGQDEQLRDMVQQTYTLPGASLLLKNRWVLDPVPQGEEWSDKFEKARRAVDRGQFRKSLKILKWIDARYPDEIPVVRGIAILHLYLGNRDAIMSAWRRLGQVLDQKSDGVSIEAVEAEAIAQIFQPVPDDQWVPVMRTTIEITDFDSNIAKSLSCPRLEIQPPFDADPFEEGPPPCHVMNLLDRDPPTSFEHVTFEDIPVIRGELLFYAKQADRPARIEWIAPRNATFEQDKTWLLEWLGDSVIGQPTDQVMRKITLLEDTLSFEWSYPKGMPTAQRNELMEEKIRAVYLGVWTNFPSYLLNGLSPRQAVEDPKYHTAVRAQMLILNEASIQETFGKMKTDTIRKELGLSPYESIDPTTCVPLDCTRFQKLFLQYDRLTDDQLEAIHTEAMMVGDFAVLKKTIEELLNRPDNGQSSRYTLMSMKAYLTHDHKEGLECLKQARTEARKAGEPVGKLLVQELDYRLSRRILDKIDDLFRVIKTHHLKEPGVKENLQSLLERFQLDPTSQADSSLYSESPTVSPSIARGTARPPSDTPEPTKIWTPE